MSDGSDPFETEEEPRIVPLPAAKRSNRNRQAARSEHNARRHHAREMALQILYEVDVTDHSAAEVLARTRAQHEVPEQTFDYLSQLIRGIDVNREAIDEHIGTAAPAFPVAQLPAVDRSVLRVAIFELMFMSEVPPKAAINEAVELAKTFGGDNSGRFVNGVLGTVLRRITAESSTAQS